MSVFPYTWDQAFAITDNRPDNIPLRFVNPFVGSSDVPAPIIPQALRVRVIPQDADASGSYHAINEQFYQFPPVAVRLGKLTRQPDVVFSLPDSIVAVRALATRYVEAVGRRGELDNVALGPSTQGAPDTANQPRPYQAGEGGGHVLHLEAPGEHIVVTAQLFPHNQVVDFVRQPRFVLHQHFIGKAVDAFALQTGRIGRSRNAAGIARRGQAGVQLSAA